MQLQRMQSKLLLIKKSMLIIYQSDAEGGAHAARLGWSGGGATAATEKLAKRPATTTLLIATHFVDHAPTSILT